MIDFHAHVLPNIDDGARDIQETFQLIEEAKKAGFSGIVLTSHYLEGYYETDTMERRIWKEVLEQNTEIKNYEVDLFLGSEVYFSQKIVSFLKEGRASTIHNSHYVLFELPMNYEPFDLYNVIYHMQSNQIIPILAHPERYPYIQKNPNIVYELIEKGVLIQSNYGSFVGQYGKTAQKIVNQLLAHNMIHFLGSDVHRASTIYLKIPEILKKLEEKIGREKLEQIIEIYPNLVIKDQKITIEQPEEMVIDWKEKLRNLFRKIIK